MENNYYPFVNLPLPYAYDALEPWIDTQTMMLHHDRHLQTYITNLNTILSQNPQLQPMSLKKLICIAPTLDDPLKTSLINNAGGVYNHRFYFNNLAPNAEPLLAGALYDAIIETFGSFDEFKSMFTAAALSVFGSGYCWLVSDKKRRLQILTTPNQNTPDFKHYIPILSIDVWEHAYYLKNYNVRMDYIANWFEVINWKQVNQNYICALVCTKK